MSTAIHDLRNELHNRSLAMRAIDRIVSTMEFEETYKRATKEDRVAISNMILNANKEGVEFWVRNQHQYEDGARNIRELRIIGQKLGIRLYNRLPKALLLSEISKCRVVLTLSGNCEKPATS